MKPCFYCYKVKNHIAEKIIKEIEENNNKKIFSEKYTIEFFQPPQEKIKTGNPDCEGNKEIKKIIESLLLSLVRHYGLPEKITTKEYEE